MGIYRKYMLDLASRQILTYSLQHKSSHRIMADLKRRRRTTVPVEYDGNVAVGETTGKDTVRWADCGGPNVCPCSFISPSVWGRCQPAMP